jgi:hypothetical protein
VNPADDVSLAVGLTKFDGMIARFFAAIALYVGEGGFAIDRGFALSQPV